MSDEVRGGGGGGVSVKVGAAQMSTNQLSDRLPPSLSLSFSHAPSPPLTYTLISSLTHPLSHSLAHSLTHCPVPHSLTGVISFACMLMSSERMRKTFSGMTSSTRRTKATKSLE